VSAGRGRIIKDNHPARTIRVTTTAEELDLLLREVRACRLCEQYLPLGPRPVLRADARARILIVGQAPGTRVHATGIPWNDPSGDRLRSGDLPPRPECAPHWHPRLRALLPDVELTLLVGQYAQAFYLGTRRKASLTATVHAWRDYLPEYLPTPHPSPRNTRWLQVNPWFERDVLPHLRARVHQLIATPSDRAHL
jgi:uracil-DNA glycosylase